MSARRNAVAVSKSSFNTITKLDIRWHPYRMHVRHELLPNDLPRRLRYSNWFNERCRNQNFLQSIIIGDEAGFALNGEVNSHNVREYAPKVNPPAFNFERTLTKVTKLTIWSALCGNGVILGPYIFYGNVNGLAYLRILNEFAFLLLAIHFNNQFWEGSLRGLWWAQDGAPDRLNEVFGENRVIALQHNVEWPPRSPDLTPCDFFLWEYLKNV